MDLDLLFKLEKLDLKGTPDNKDIVILKFLEQPSQPEIASLQDTIQKLGREGDWQNVTFLMLPPHISLSTISDEDLDQIGLCRK